jgi:hypothetical protein
MVDTVSLNNTSVSAQVEEIVGTAMTSFCAECYYVERDRGALPSADCNEVAY